jgi:hypothetical protein
VIAKTEYIVERIVEEKGVIGQDRKQFKVKWQDWPEVDATWETEDALVNCPEVLTAWKAGQRQEAEEAKEGTQRDGWKCNRRRCQFRSGRVGRGGGRGGAMFGPAARGPRK